MCPFPSMSSKRYKKYFLGCQCRMLGQHAESSGSVLNITNKTKTLQIKPKLEVSHTKPKTFCSLQTNVWNNQLENGSYQMFCSVRMMSPEFRGTKMWGACMRLEICQCSSVVESFTDMPSGSQPVGHDPFGKPLSPKNIYNMIHKSNKIKVRK